MRALLTAFFIVLLFSTCKKEEEPTMIHHDRISVELRQFLFDTGSYWVYRDTVTNTFDSVAVSSIIRHIEHDPPVAPGEGSTRDNEIFQISYQAYPANITWAESLIDSFISRGNIYGGVSYICTGNIGSTIHNATIEAILDSLTVEGQQYYNVVKMNVQADSYISPDCKLYYVAGIGVIKKENLSSGTVTETWNLVNYHTDILPY